MPYENHVTKGKSNIEYCSHITFKEFCRYHEADLLFFHYSNMCSEIDIPSNCLWSIKTFFNVDCSFKERSKQTRKFQPLLTAEFVFMEEMSQTPPTEAATVTSWASLFASAVFPLSWKLCNYPWWAFHHVITDVPGMSLWRQRRREMETVKFHTVKFNVGLKNVTFYCDFLSSNNQLYSESIFNFTPSEEIAPSSRNVAVKTGPCVSFSRSQTAFLNPIHCHSCWNRV